MINNNTFRYRILTGLLSVFVPMSSMPMWALADEYSGSKTGNVVHEKSNSQGSNSTKVELSPSRKLSAEELKKLKGRTNDVFDANPYVAGTNKWDVVHNGINLVTGNFTTSATDLSFEGGYGIPVNLTRSYSANNPDEGPFGIGWTPSVDIRSTAGGVLKSSGSPIRSVPVQFKERPSNQVVPGPPSNTQPVEAVVTTDASGAETTVQRDVDGVLTTPPWDKNEIESEYEMVISGSSTYEVLVSSSVRTPEGTVYQYTKQGYYGSGQYAYNEGSQSTFTPSNLLKISSVTDRHGNTTNYTYLTGTGTASQAVFQKYNGDVTEQKLSSISMPGPRYIRFTWGDGTSATENTPTDRIWKAYDGDTVSTSERVIKYGYTSGQLTTVTTTMGRVTTYGYGGVTTGGPVSPQTTDGISVLKSITDCRGLQTQINYVVSDSSLVLPYNVGVRALVAYQVILPNGTMTLTKKFNTTWPVDPGYGGVNHNIDYKDVLSTSNTASLGEGKLYLVGNSSNLIIDYRFGTPNGTYEPGHHVVRKTFDLDTYNCIEEEKYLASGTNLELYGTKAGDRFMPSASGADILTQTDFNCFGAPLSKTVTEDNVGTSNDRVTTISYAYWGASKYYQQRAVRSPKEGGGYRYSFTDYFDDQAADGKKGQTRFVWGPDVMGTPITDTNVPVPAGTSTSNPDDSWKYQLFPASWNSTATYKGASAAFDYDGQGRATDVWKIPAAGTSGTYIHTETDYSGEFGLPSYVVEAEGTSNARTTYTHDYDPIGRATEVEDALGRVFVTHYNDDGQIEYVEKTDGPGANGTLVTYTYGPSGISKGMVTHIVDHLSGYEQSITYHDSGGGIGQVELYEEEDEYAPIYSIEYSYTDAGDRDTVLYATPEGSTKWKYSDYTFVGTPGNISRVFQTLNKQQYINSTVKWKNSSEEIHFDYDFSGRLANTAFAQSIDTGNSVNSEHPFTPNTTYEYYPAGHPAERRILTNNEYDSAGRILTTKTVSQLQTEGAAAAYVPNGYSTPGTFYQNDCTYTSVLGLKSTSRNRHWNAAGASVRDALESYTYDSLRDYLTQVIYDDDNNINTTNVTNAWTYDYAGNRSNSGYTYDNLNRMTASPGLGSYSTTTYINDAVGNRIARNYTPGQAGQPNDYARMYNWDVLNRMTATAGAAAGSGYRNVYRADGMRVMKVDDIDLAFTEDPNAEEDNGSGFYDSITLVDKPTTRYFYDGQMCMQEEITETVNEEAQWTYTRYGLGARGIDYIEKQVNQGSVSVAFPVYDGHGNMVMTLSRSGNGWSDGLHRSFDVWGSLRWNPSSSADVKQRYCANLGHVEDDASGLVYMRARYYEPWTGRFISEDPAMDGGNWYVYCSGDPVNYTDLKGKSKVAAAASIAGFLLGFLQELWESYHDSGRFSLENIGPALWKAALGAAMGIGTALALQWYGTEAMGIAQMTTIGFSGGVAAAIIFLTARYAGMCMVVCLWEIFDDIFLGNTGDYASQPAPRFDWGF